MELSISIQIWKKDKWYIAKCPELDFVSQGMDRDEARRNLLETVHIQLEEMAELGTLDVSADMSTRMTSSPHTSRWWFLRSNPSRWRSAAHDRLARPCRGPPPAAG